MVRTAAADAHEAFRSRSSLPTIQAALAALQPRSTGSPAPLQVAPPSQTTIEAPPSKSVQFSLETPAAAMAAHRVPPPLQRPSFDFSTVFADGAFEKIRDGQPEVSVQQLETFLRVRS